MQLLKFHLKKYVLLIIFLYYKYKSMMIFRSEKILMMEKYFR